MSKSSTAHVLIITHVEDIHAYAVAEALKHKGAEVELWHTSDFPSRGQETILFEGDKMSVGIRGSDFCLTDPAAMTTVWNRRSMVVVNDDLLHEADRKFAEAECRMARSSFFNILSRSSFWVNPWVPGTLAEHKPAQHRAAVDVGLKTPDTLYTNDPILIREFMHKHEGKVVYKGLRPRPWTDGEKLWMPYTAILREADLPDDDILQSTPGIYQKIVEKDHELRVTVMGNRIFSAKILSQETSKGRLDWRRSYDELKMVPHELDPDIAASCLAFMDRLGLMFGCFDFIVSSEGDCMFLEVNQMGQFLFVEAYSGLPLLDAFSEFLIQARADFEWDAERADVFFDQSMRDRVRMISDQFKENHVQITAERWDE